MNFKKIIFGTAIIGAGTILFLYFNRQYKLLNDSCLRLAGVKKLNANLTKFETTILYAYLNKSEISVEILSQHYNVYINNFIVSTIDSKEKTKIPSKGKAIMELEVSFKPKELVLAGLKNIDQLINDHQQVMVKISGQMSIRAGVIWATIPFEDSMTLADLMKPSDHTAIQC